MTDTVLSQLVTMSQNLGDPVRDYAILGEGNTSARADEATFFVKASGREMRTIGADGFVRVSFDRVLGVLDGEPISDSQVKDALVAAKVDPTAPGHPSVETFLHALCLKLPGVNFVGHTHPTAINMITCSAAFPDAVKGRIFPDEIVVCGPAPVIVPYVDPGLPLARMVKQQIERFLDEYGEVPKVILMQNHGFIALAPSAQQVENITAMAVKAARILVGTYALGGPNYMTEDNVRRIHTRPDEHYRQKVIGLK